MPGTARAGRTSRRRGRGCSAVQGRGGLARWSSPATCSSGLLDSLHYRPALPPRTARRGVYSHEVLSVLDVALSHLRERTRAHLFGAARHAALPKEQVEQPDGKSVRDFPRLRHGGAHLKDEARAGRAMSRCAALVGSGAGCGLWLVALRRRAEGAGAPLAAGSLERRRVRRSRALLAIAGPGRVRSPPATTCSAPTRSGRTCSTRR